MKKCILIIDDDEEICKELKEILEDEEYLIDTANDGIKGMQLIVENNYDIILLDIKLPGMNGIEILKKTKELNKNIKVIIITGRPFATNDLLKDKNKENEDKILFELSDGIFNKPFNIIDILSKIKGLLN